MKYFDEVFIKLTPPSSKGDDTTTQTPNAQQLLTVAIHSNQVSAARRLLQFQRDYNHSNTTSDLIVGEIVGAAKHDRHAMITLLFDELETTKYTKKLERISINSVFQACKSFTMLQLIHARRNRFYPHEQTVNIPTKVIQSLTCNTLQAFLQVLRAGLAAPNMENVPGRPQQKQSIIRFNDDLACIDILVHHMDNQPLIDMFFKLHTLNKQFITNSAFYNWDGNNEDSDYDVDQDYEHEICWAIQRPEGLSFVHRYRDHLPLNALYWAAGSHGDLELAKWATAKGAGANLYNRLLANALQNGHIDVVNHLLDNCTVGSWMLDSQIHESILTMGLLNRLASHSTDIKWGESVLLSPALTLNMFEYINTSCLKHPVDEAVLLCNPKIMLVKDINLLRYLVERSASRLNKDMMLNAVIAVRHDVLEAFAAVGFTHNLEAFGYLILADKARCLMAHPSLLTPTYDPQFAHPPLVDIVRLDDVSLVRDFNTMFGHVKGISSPSAMKEAAILGNLDIVRFLHEHRTEGCEADTLECAANAGHMDVVKFLINNLPNTQWSLTQLGRDTQQLDTNIVDYILQSNARQYLSLTRDDIILKVIQSGYLPLMKAYVDTITRGTKEQQKAFVNGNGFWGKLPVHFFSAMDCGYDGTICLQYLIDHLLRPNIVIDIPKLLRQAYSRGHLLMIEYCNKLTQ
ncbi:hypothetical protein SAMD00019534_063550 [Acytostelium subglobosum LB1]|uniref:hypothetical protein n=1 Tax=Acytostelium subglobosum LB1 TaxID=1410327 RepID=UPI0006449AFF|nr:hypothetical protein SAMD00019534_063550 [Acytostelium subglobosum LB1]GAM23180.1 hypothetical protein SAMD00019534_063550 [Acytostelium subglobosum LB1]|eukprot:XP_012753629.1 hypothetical protein SAMD00019534_063550 [Acytostelium subglobosum LB1]